MGHHPPYQTHMMPCTASVLSYLWERYFIKIHRIPIYGNDMGYGYGMGWLPCEGMIWEWYESFNQSHTITHIYGKDTYFVKIHTIPIHGNDMGYGNGIGWLPCKGMIWEWYGSLNQSHTNPISINTFSTSYGKTMGLQWERQLVPIENLYLSSLLEVCNC